MSKLYTKKELKEKVEVRKEVLKEEVLRELKQIEIYLENNPVSIAGIGGKCYYVGYKTAIKDLISTMEGEKDTTPKLKELLQLKKKQ